MQGQKGAIGSLPEGLALEHGSGSNDSGAVEQQLHWSNFIRNPPANVNQETQSLSMWSVGESSSSIVPNQVCPNQVDPKTGHAWSSFLKSQHEPRQQELPASRLSLGGVNMNTSHTHSNSPHHHHSHNATLNPSAFIGMKPSNYASSSSGPIEMDARQLPCKRKEHELDIGQSSSAIEGSNILQRPEGSNSVWQPVSENPTLTNTMPIDPIIPRLGSGIGGIGGVSSDNRALENFRRNVRIRFDNPRQQDQLPASNNNISNNGLLNFSTQYPSLGLNPVATTVDSSSSREGQPMLQAPVLRRNLYASSRSRSSSSRANPLVTSSVISTSGDNLRTPQTSILDHSFIVQPPTVINLDVDTVGGPTSLPSASNAMLNMGPHRGSSLYRSRRQGEILRRSLLSSIDTGAGGGGSGGGQTTNLFSSIPPPVGASASSSQESRAPRVIAIAGRHPHHHLAQLRTSSRQLDGAFGFPYVSRTVAGGSGRRGRLMSEMRDVLDRLRRGEGLRFEDVMILDQSVFYDMADIHDRHRDMRLDIDNMSYEELLALEERIGNVNTGLTEENIYKHLKQKTYTHVSGQPDDEPCCICQEEYKNGDDLGALACGHEFHTSCIKQWLLQKNSCPVCKAAASK